MARKLSQNTINKFKKRLEAEREQLLSMLEQHQEEREKVRLSEASAERSPDPTSADGGSMAFELEKELHLMKIPNICSTKLNMLLYSLKRKSMATVKTVVNLFQ